MCEPYNEIIEPMFNQAEQVASEGEIESARVQYSAIIDFIERRDEPNLNDKAIALKRLADCQRELQRKEEAIESHKKALEIYRAIDNPEGGINSLNDVGSLYEDDGNYSESIAQYEQALAMALENNLREMEAMIRNNIGYVLMLSGKDEEALGALQKALDISRGTGQKRLEAITLSNIAMLYKAWRLLDKAKERFEEASKLNQEIANVDGELEDCLGIGSVCYQLNEFEQSKKALQRAFALCEKSKTSERGPEIEAFLGKIESEAHSMTA